MPFIETVSQKSNFSAICIYWGILYVWTWESLWFISSSTTSSRTPRKSFLNVAVHNIIKEPSWEGFLLLLPSSARRPCVSPHIPRLSAKLPTTHLIWGKGEKEEKKGEEEATIFSVCISQNAGILFLDLSYSRYFLSIYCPEKYPFALLPFSPGQY